MRILITVITAAITSAFIIFIAFTFLPVIMPDSEGNLETHSLYPEEDEEYSLGSSSRKYKELWLSGTLLKIGDEVLQMMGQGCE